LPKQDAGALIARCAGLLLQDCQIALRCSHPLGKIRVGSDNSTAQPVGGKCCKRKAFRLSRLIKIADWSGIRRVNVIFVHGIGGNAYDTWRKDDSSLWPLWLAKDIRGAAVYTLSYESPIFNWLGTAMPLHDQAVNVLRSLLAEPDLRNGPIVFVCHSLGGLVIKQVFRDANEQRADDRPNIADFVERTKLVVFIATPHTGADHASFLDRIRFIAWPSASARDLVANDAGLRSLNVGYRRIAEARREDLQHLVYFEKHDTAVGRIVKEGPSDPGLFKAEPAPIPRDHVAIAKVPDKDDLIYRETRDQIVALAPEEPDSAKFTEYELRPDLIEHDRSWGQFVPKAMRLAVILLIVGVGIAWALADDGKQAKFDAIYDQTFSRSSISPDLKSARVAIMDRVPNNILPENGPAQWAAVSRILSKSVKVIEDAYKPIVFCLSSKECRPGRRATALCTAAKAEWNGYKSIIAKLGAASGITVNRQAGATVLGDTFGSVVDLPEIPNLRAVLLLACGINTDEDPSLRTMIESEKTKIEQAKASREKTWDDAMCPMFMELLDAAVGGAAPSAIGSRFPTPAKCNRTADDTVECEWIDPVAQRGKFIGVVSGGSDVANLDVIDGTMNECFSQHSSSVKVVRAMSDKEKLRGHCPFAIRSYRYTSSNRSYDVNAETESCDTTINFTTTVKLKIREAQGG
jgi:pimeloyl-ACP methyl ester carboxylesterase